MGIVSSSLKRSTMITSKCTSARWIGIPLG